MGFANMNQRYLLIPFLIYGVPNVLGFASIIAFDVLIVDMFPIVKWMDNSDVFVAFLAVLASFGLLYFLLRTSLGFFEGRRGGKPLKAIEAIGKIVFALQLLTLTAAIFIDYGRAGGEPTPVSILAVLASYAKADFLFLLYYSHARPGSFPKYNLLAYIASNTIRGWSGFWLILFLVESYYFFYRSDKRYKIQIPAICLLLAMLAVPAVGDLKNKMRGSEVASTGYLEAYVRLLNRLQHVTNVSLIAQNTAEIREKYAAEKISPWYAYNRIARRIFGISEDSVALERHLVSEYIINLDYLGRHSSDLGWDTNPGIAGWLFVIEWHQIPIYILYISALICAPYVLISRYLGATSMIPVAHAASFVFALHGWIGVQLEFVLAVASYVLLTRFLHYVVAVNDYSNRRRGTAYAP